MSKQSESLDVGGKTVDEAIEAGLAKLGLVREQVHIEILKEGKRGVFGIGSEDAQVRLTRRSQAAAAQAAPLPRSKSEVDMDAPEEISMTSPTDADQLAVEDVAVRCLGDLLKLMGIKATVTLRLGSDLVEPGESPVLVLDITGGDLGVLIGRRSETLQALQFMVRVMVSKHIGSWQPLVVDVESYRVRRRQSLRQMAQKMAERVVATRKKVVLEAMPPHERRIIHIALREHPAVITRSIGAEDNRKVTIIPK
jgi:spoIIIJ-associated protein